VLLTMLALLSTRETVAVDTLARRATCSRFIADLPLQLSANTTVSGLDVKQLSLPSSVYIPQGCTDGGRSYTGR
jgi:hypothetical protein